MALLGSVHRMGRLNADAEQEAENIRVFLERCGAERRGNGMTKYYHGGTAGPYFEGWYLKLPRPKDGREAWR